MFKAYVVSERYESPVAKKRNVSVRRPRAGDAGGLNEVSFSETVGAIATPTKFQNRYLRREKKTFQKPKPHRHSSNSIRPARSEIKSSIRSLSLYFCRSFKLGRTDEFASFCVHECKNRQSTQPHSPKLHRPRRSVSSTEKRTRTRADFEVGRSAFSLGVAERHSEDAHLSEFPAGNGTIATKQLRFRHKFINGSKKKPMQSNELFFRRC